MEGIFLRIFLLDDQALPERTLRSRLRCRAGVELICLQTREELLEEYRRRPADLILIRLGNTRFNGLRLAKEFLTADTRSKVAFVSQSREYARLAFDAGAMDFLLEPVDERALDELISRIEKDIGKLDKEARL